jgi:hypothetical protein
LGEDYQTILYEVQAQLGVPHGINAPSAQTDNNWLQLQIEVNLSHVVNFCDPSTQASLQTTTQELTGNWDGYQSRGEGAAPTQQLGNTLFSCSNIEAFIGYSAKVPTRKILIVFPQRLRATSFVRGSIFDGSRQVSWKIP